MNHERRAKNIVRSALAPHLHKSDLFDRLVLEVARGLRDCERDARRNTLLTAANLVGKIDGRNAAFYALLKLVWPRSAPQHQRTRVAEIEDL